MDGGKVSVVTVCFVHSTTIILINGETLFLSSRDKHVYCIEGNHGYDNLYRSMQVSIMIHVFITNNLHTHV